MGKKISYEATEEAQLTSEGRESDLAHLKANNARALPSSPTANGWSADAIKRQLYRPSEIIFFWLLRLASAQLALAKSVDDCLDGETKRLDLDIAKLRDSVDDARANGYAKFDDEGRIIKDTYLMKRDLKIADRVQSGNIDPVSSDGVYAYLDDRGATDVEIMGFADWED